MLYYAKPPLLSFVDRCAPLAEMPPRKRTAAAAEVEVPLATRARNALMQLDAALAETLPLLEAADAGATPPLPVAQLLYDSVFARLARTQAVARAELFAPFGRTWLPDDVIGYILEFVTNRRTMSHFGPGGTVLPGAVRPTFFPRVRGEAPQLQTLRLVCKKWACVAGRLVVRLDTPRPSIRFASAAQVCSAFPSAQMLMFCFNAPSAAYWTRANAVITHYTAGGSRLFYVGARHLDAKHLARIEFGTAFYLHSMRLMDLQVNPNLVQIVTTPPTWQANAIATTAENFFTSLRSGLPWRLSLASVPLVNDASLAKFNVPIIYIQNHGLRNLIRAGYLFDKNNWLNETFPTFVYECFLGESTRTGPQLKQLISLVGAEHVKIVERAP
jgi:hypothetical protein